MRHTGLSIFLWALAVIITFAAVLIIRWDNARLTAQIEAAEPAAASVRETTPAPESNTPAAEAAPEADEPAGQDGSYTDYALTETDPEDAEYESYTEYVFRNDELLNEHYEKHGIEMGFTSAEDYQDAASDVVEDPAAEHKTEAEDGDDVYYIESTNEFVVVSTDGYIRTYFCPDDGRAYFDRQ